MRVEDQREEGRLSGDVKVLVRLEEIVRDHKHRRVRCDREQRERGRHADRPSDRRGDGRLHGREGDEEGGRRVAVVHLRRVRVLLQSVEEGGRLADRGVRRRRFRRDHARLHRQTPRERLHCVEGRVEPIGSLLPPQRRAAVGERFQRRERWLVRAVTTADEAGGAAVEGEGGGGDARDQQLVVARDGGGAGG